jgi:very-short-patch-repair endonuclease
LLLLSMADNLTIPSPPGFEGFSNEQMISLCATMLTKWSELVVKEMRDDIARVDGMDIYEQTYLRAKWLKTIDLILAAKDAIGKYDTPEGKLDLIIQQFGDQLGMPAHSLAGDVKRRMDWYKQRVAATFERSIAGDLNRHEIRSPVEQIFLMEWRYLEMDRKHNVTIKPQTQMTVAGSTYRIDFVVTWPEQKQKLAIEIDGHEFHEKTKQQAARDRARERSIVREGYTIMRYTGSEVFANPRKCVQEVASLIGQLRA